MHVALIFPPLCDPRAPQLALPSLAGFLRKAGIEVSMHDVNLTGIVDLCTRERLTETLRRLVERLDRSREADIARAVWTAEQLVELAPVALCDLRDRTRFFDPMRHADARKTVDNVLRTASLASPGLDAGLSPIRYVTRGLDPASLRDLLSATERPALDLFRPTVDALIREFTEAPPTLVGISITNRQQIVPGLILARRLRAEGYFVVIGGAVFSKFRDALRDAPEFFHNFASAVVVYEGETALLALADALRHGGELRRVPNLLFASEGRVIATSTHVEDVSSLPTPDFAGLPLDDYLAPYPVLPILTGKGCYFNRCKFCDIPYINHVSRKPYRVRPVEQVVDDVHELHRRHAASHFVITDEALSPKLLTELADAFKDRAGDFSMTGYARPEPGFTAEACRRIAGFGLRKLFFGIESGSQSTLDHMDKGVRIDDVPKVLANCREAGIDFHLFSIVGLPQETADEARKTLRFLTENEPTINRPGCSFDIHPFGLELRTPYFSGREAYGIELQSGTLAREFIIGLDDSQWKNSGGLSPQAAKRMIATDFAPTLRQVFRDWHAAPDPIWPPQEEYAVLYSSRYRNLPFPWKTRLPLDDDDDTPFAFVPSRIGFGPVEGQRVRLGSLDYDAWLPAALVAMIGSGKTLPWTMHFREGSCDIPKADIRQYLEALIELGLLAIKVAATDSAGTGA